MSATGKSGSGGSVPNTIGGGYQPTQQAQSTFQSGVAQQQPGTAQQLNQIAGGTSPALNTMVNQQMAPQGPTGAAPQAQQFQQYNSAVFGGDPNSIYTPNFNQPTAQTQPNPGNNNAIGMPDNIYPSYVPGEALAYDNLQSGPITLPDGSQGFLDYAQPKGGSLAGQPITLPGGQSLDLNPPAPQPRSLMPIPQPGFPGQYTQDQLDAYNKYTAWNPGNTNNPFEPVAQLGWYRKPIDQWLADQGTPQPPPALPLPITPDGRNGVPVSQPTPLMPVNQPIASPAMKQPSPTQKLLNAAPRTGPAPKVAPVPRTTMMPAKPVAKPAPMPTRAAKGYTSRVAAKPVIRTGPKPVR